jgi:hypothetical protein
MSGLEIAAGIAGIISAFVTVGRAIRAYQKSREKKKLALLAAAKTAETRLINAVDTGPQRIKHEYDGSLTRIGPAFAKGDGNSPSS